ncbi:MAG: hypothetical protein ACE5JS_16305 [Nitrospinota bacterium]
MHARLVSFAAEPEIRSTAQKLAEEGASVYKAQKGFRSVIFLADDAANEYGAFSVWDSKEDADVAAAALGARVQKEIGDKLKGAPSVRLFEVLHEAKV